MTTEPGSLESFNENVLMLWVIAVLVLAGSLLCPALLRCDLAAISLTRLHPLLRQRALPRPPPLVDPSLPLVHPDR